MRFEEVLPALREGKKITNSIIKNWGRKYIYYKGGTIFSDKGGFWHLTYIELVENDDWEIVKETKKVKLRDLTPEQFEKWGIENCEKYNCSKDCPFRILECSDTFWMSCKDMLSDKFLDQEIEIKETENGNDRK